jgi:hypothetical protein
MDLGPVPPGASSENDAPSGAVSTNLTVTSRGSIDASTYWPDSSQTDMECCSCPRIARSTTWPAVRRSGAEDGEGWLVAPRPVTTARKQYTVADSVRFGGNRNHIDVSP